MQEEKHALSSNTGACHHSFRANGMAACLGALEGLSVALYKMDYILQSSGQKGWVALGQRYEGATMEGKE